MSGYKKFSEIEQFDFIFLKKNGLKENHKFLDIGCGGGRLGYSMINYLDKNNYYGFDKEDMMINAFIKSISDKKYKCLQNKNPEIKKLNLNDFYNIIGNNKFDYIYAYSVFTHLKYDEFKNFLLKIKKNITKETKVFASFLLGTKYFEGCEHGSRKDEISGVWYDFKSLNKLNQETGFNIEFIGDEDYNWEGVKRKLFDKKIALANKKKNSIEIIERYNYYRDNGAFNPFVYDDIENKFSYGGRLEMFLITLK